MIKGGKSFPKIGLERHNVRNSTEMKEEWEGPTIWGLQLKIKEKRGKDLIYVVVVKDSVTTY